MRVVDIIDRKRRGVELANAEIDFLVHGYTTGSVPDYQMSAWLMAVLWRGLTDTETYALTAAMVASGDVLDLSGIPGSPVDKHSTGGVGDKTTLAVVPILASAGVPVAKMSGRGLGNTGGTLDKLESLPGVRTQLSPSEIIGQVRDIGACFCAQTERLVPADKRIYALRDATATVESIPLIAASIMSKKIAGGSHSILLDVKLGSGAFMKSLPEARRLAELMVKIGANHGRRVVAMLTDMDAPLGTAVGNGLEIAEVVDLLQNAPAVDQRLKQLVRYLAGIGFHLAGRVTTLEEGEVLADRQVASGAAFAKFREIIDRQGGDPEFLAQSLRQRAAPAAWDIKSAAGGIVTRIDAAAIGMAAMHLGAGRKVKEDSIDPAAGITLRVGVGSRVSAGSVVATLHAGTEALAREVEPLAASAFTISDARSFKSAPLIYETVGLYGS